MAGSQHSHAIARVIATCLVLLHPVDVRGDNINFPTRKPESSTVGGVWPRPQKQDLSDQYVGIPDSFSFQVVGKSCDILDDAMSRYTALLKTNWRRLTKLDLVNTSPNIAGRTAKLEIKLVNDCEKYPHLDMDEKYILEVKEGSSLLAADSIWGILRGLETFCQLPAPAPNMEQLIIQVQKIEDFPKYSHRGLLIDTSRHFLSLKTIKNQLDILSYNKMNVLHWHMVDDQSFPYQSNRFPSLSEKGAFDPDAVYTAAMIQEVVEHARLRGVRVIPEFDTPGHTDSSDPAMPDIHCHCPYPDHIRREESFVGPLDPTKNATYDFVRGLLAEVYERFPDSYVHLGGDEVDYYCWNRNPEINSFMAARQWNGQQLQSYYMQNILNTKDRTRKAIVWEEVYNKWENFNGNASSFDKDTIVQLWKGSGLLNVKKITSSGFKVINSNEWYLDNLSNLFQQFYEADLSTTGDLTAEENKLFLGGEACMWGENVDDTNIESRVWPRACAVAEHLWTAAKKEDGMDSFRITEHVCRLRRRNVQAAPAYSISYCADTLVRHGHRSTGSFPLTTLRQRLGLSDDVTYQVVNSTHSEKVIDLPARTGEKSNASVSDEKPSGDAPVNEPGANSASVPGMSALVLLLWSSVGGCLHIIDSEV